MRREAVRTTGRRPRTSSQPCSTLDWPTSPTSLERLGSVLGWHRLLLGARDRSGWGRACDDSARSSGDIWRHRWTPHHRTHLRTAYTDTPAPDTFTTRASGITQSLPAAQRALMTGQDGQPLPVSKAHRTVVSDQGCRRRWWSGWRRPAW